jgi:hypothetical protein
VETSCEWPHQGGILLLEATSSGRRGGNESRPTRTMVLDPIFSMTLTLRSLPASPPTLREVHVTQYRAKSKFWDESIDPSTSGLFAQSTTRSATGDRSSRRGGGGAPQCWVTLGNGLDEPVDLLHREDPRPLRLDPRRGDSNRWVPGDGLGIHRRRQSHLRRLNASWAREAVSAWLRSGRPAQRRPG